MSPYDPNQALRNALAYVEGMCDQSKGLDLSKCPYLDQPGKEIEHRFYVDGLVAGVHALDLPKTERAEEAPIPGHGINIEQDVLKQLREP